MQKKSVLPFLEVAESISYPTAKAAYVARSRGVFPVRVRAIGGKLVCFASDRDEYLRTGESQAHLSTPRLKRDTKFKTGRPTKTETLKAEALGVTVRELRLSAGV